jgi:pilus assembly protein CpaC
MNRPTRFTGLALLPLLAGLILVGGIGRTEAQTPLTPRASVTRAGDTLTLEAGAGRVIGLGRAATSVFAADPKVVEVRPASATSLFLFGVGPGRTTVAALDASGSPIAQYDVTVSPSSFAAQAVTGIVSRQSQGAQINAEGRVNGVTLGGSVNSPIDAQRALASARMTVPSGQKVQTNFGVRQGIQVNLRVRVVEMSRALTRQLGINWSANGRLGRIGVSGTTNSALSTISGLSPSVATIAGLGKTSFEAIIDALAQDQLIRSLAEPNLTTMSGEPASFIVGGEFPIPVSQQNNTISIEFKQFGVSLAFVPTVLDGGQINLKVRPEVSELSNQGAVTLGEGNSTIQIPALTVRRAETTVTLGSGQSFAIAGLLQDTVTHTANAVPLLGDLPVLGALFRSDSFQRNQTELVIIVTPYVVGPSSDPAELQVPDPGYTAPNDFERVVLLRQLGRVGGVDPALTIPGAAGFVMQ